MFLIFFFIGFILNYFTHFHNILKTKSSKHIKKFTILVQNLTRKHKKPNITFVMPHLFVNVAMCKNFQVKQSQRCSNTILKKLFKTI